MSKSAKYQIAVSTLATGGRVFCYAYLVKETMQQKQPSYMDENGSHVKDQKASSFKLSHFGLLSRVIKKEASLQD